jgi:hypothetical protein
MKMWPTSWIPLDGENLLMSNMILYQRQKVSFIFACHYWTRFLTSFLFMTDQPLPPHLPNPYRTTIRNLLKFELDICSVPRVSFFEWLAAFSEGDMKEKLTWFCDGEGQVSWTFDRSSFSLQKTKI